MNEPKYYKKQVIGNGVDPERPFRQITLMTTPKNEIWMQIFDDENEPKIKVKLPLWDARALRKALDEAIKASGE
ncbi:hypothetical protein [Thiomicrorhabdus cannonii]|uniref:hypothetical protein n=1 Tax=Thiomicrorhabdus cannonii TaxID=2748011 RepID=UPI0015BD7967|nr:hypothetical protein [Thiomicrorhabdus cannonii]